MKKIKLLLVAFAAMVSLSASAWDGSEGKVYLQNIGSGLWWGAGNTWGTQASLVNHPEYVTLHLSEGKYTLEGQVINGGSTPNQYYFNGNYMDNASPVSLTITTSGDYYTIANGETYYGYDGSSTVLGKGVDATTDNGKWRIFTEAEMLANFANATEENPVDATFLILDPNFGRNHRNKGAWTIDASNSNLGDGENTNFVAESYQSAFTLSQAITVPNGHYKLRAQAALTEYTVTGADFPIVYATSGATTVSQPFNTMQNGEASMKTMSTQFSNGNYFTDYTEVLTVTSKSITVGVKGTRTNTWCVWDNFELLYLGQIDLTEYQTGLANAVAAAEAYESQLPAAAYANIAAVISENNKSYETGDEYSAAIIAINNAVSTYASAAIVSAYSNYKAVAAAVKAIKDDLLTVADAQAEAATTAEAIETATATARTALKTYIAGVEEEEIDLTAALLINPGFESGNMNGWMDDSSGSATIGVQNNTAFDNKQGNYYAECWHKSGSILLTQIVADMPAGWYQLSAYIYCDAKDGSLFIMDSDGASSEISASKSKRYTVYIHQDNTGELLFAFGCTMSNTSWICMDDFKLEFLGTAPLYTFQQKLYNAAVAATAYVDALVIPAGVKQTYKYKINMASYQSSTIDKCIQSISDIEDAKAAADAFVAPYAAYLAAAEDAAIAGVDEAIISEQNTAVAEVSAAEDIEEHTAALRTAIAAVTVTPYDITSYTIKNATPTSNADDWTCSVTPTFDASNNDAEFWNQSAATLKQTITLPAGNYCLTVIALQRENSVGTIEAAGKTTRIVGVPRSTANNLTTANSFFNSGGGVNKVYFTLDSEQEVTIGIKADDTTDDHWTVWRSFTLGTYTESVAVSYLEAPYQAAFNAAMAVWTSHDYVNVTGNELTDLIAAINDSPTTIDSYEEKTNALISATSAYTAAKTNYDLYVTERTLADAISTDIVIPSPSSAGPSTAADALTQYCALKVAEYNYVADEYKFSATSKIGDFSTWERSGSVNGNTDVTFEALTSQHWSGTAMTYYEQPKGGWDQNGATFTANYTKTTTLPAGDYIIKVAARAASGSNTTAKITCSASYLDGPIPNLGDTGKGITTDGVASFDEGEFCNDGNGRGWVWNYLPFTLNGAAEVTMTVIAEADGARQWFSVCDGELLSKTNIATPVVYNEMAYNNTIEDIDVANVIMVRTIKEGFNTVCLPFDLTANQVQTVFGSGTEVYTFSENSADPEHATVNFTKHVAGTISANVPVLVKATAASTEQEINGVEIITGETIAEGTNFDFVGVYTPTTVEAGDWFIGNGALYKSTGSTSINAFRAYLDNKVGTTEARLFIDGVETTGIESLTPSLSEGEGVKAVYDLQGRKVANPSRGLYIINGKKVVIK